MWTLYVGKNVPGQRQKIASSEYKNEVLGALYGFNNIGRVDLNNETITAYFWNEEKNSYELDTRPYWMVRE